MTIRLHSITPQVGGGFRITGDAIDFHAPDFVELWQGDALLLRDNVFNPNFTERTPPTRPRRNLFILDVEPAHIGAMTSGSIRLAVNEREASRGQDFAIPLDAMQPAIGLKPDPARILSNPRGFDRELDQAAHHNVKAIHHAIMSLVEEGILKYSPHELSVKWLDLAVFSLLCDGVNSPVLTRLDRIHRAITELAPGSYAEASALASKALIDGEAPRAMQIYEDASIANYLDVSPWTSGMAGMNSIATLTRFSGAAQFFDSSFEIVGPPPKNRPTILISSDSSYFKRFGIIYLSSARNHLKNTQVHCNVINPSEGDLVTMQEALLKLGGIVSFSVSRYDVDSFEPANRVGFYTLNRFLILQKFLRLCDVPVLVTEADASLTNESEGILQQLGDKDVGYLAMQRYVRPWMHTTAPLVYVNNTEYGRFFCKALFSSIVASLIKNSGRYLWGIDQAAIYCAAKYTEARCPSIKTVNLIPLANAIIYQAQQHPQGKEGFLEEKAREA